MMRFRGRLWLFNYASGTIDRDALLGNNRITDDWRARTPFPGILRKLVGIDSGHLRREVL
jgi:hypothetical protein